MSNDVWYPVAGNDIFPEEFATFLLTDPAIRSDFLKDHADLLDAAWWRQAQREIGAMPVEVLSYPDSIRFGHGARARHDEAQPDASLPDGQLTSS
jgi:isocitrate dehydrogenase kinase/phosphatase